ncbi:sugar-binding domain-containing protein [Microbacterium aurantiacum]|uniref:sugar-binding domain-containing protein n=1 Tax=Microbacterium aurantiacum TaxID=162393 RepID=UPI004036416A
MTRASCDVQERCSRHGAKVVVVHADGDEEHVRSRVAGAGAEFLSSTLRDGEVLGMAWGRTLSALTTSLPRLPRMSIVQRTSAAGSDLGQSPVELVRLIAQNSGVHAETAHWRKAVEMTVAAGRRAGLAISPDDVVPDDLGSDVAVLV